MDGNHTPQYFPDILLDEIFSNLDVSDLLSCMLVCKNWYGVLTYKNTLPWKAICQRKLRDNGSCSESHSKLGSYKAVVQSYMHGWDPNYCSTNIRIRPNGITLCYHPTALTHIGTACAKIGYASGVHEWEMSWNRPTFSPNFVCCMLTRESFQRLYSGPTVNDEHRANFTPCSCHSSPSNHKLRLVLDWERHEWKIVIANRETIYEIQPSREKLYPVVLFTPFLMSSLTIIYKGNNTSNGV